MFSLRIRGPIISFVLHIKKLYILCYPKCAQRGDWSDCAGCSEYLLGVNVQGIVNFGFSFCKAKPCVRALTLFWTQQNPFSFSSKSRQMPSERELSHMYDVVFFQQYTKQSISLWGFQSYICWGGGVLKLLHICVNSYIKSHYWDENNCPMPEIGRTGFPAARNFGKVR